MLQNDYLVAKIGVDSAENEPREESCGHGDGPVPRLLSPADRSHFKKLPGSLALRKLPGSLAIGTGGRLSRYLPLRC